MKNRLRKSGFTLIELMAVVGMFTLITGGLFSFLSSSRFSVDTNEARIQAIQSARLAMEQVKRELRLSQAGKVHLYNDLATRSTIVGAVVYFQLPVGIYEDSLIPHLNHDNSLIWGSADTQGSYIYYCLDPGSQRLFRATCNDEGQGVQNTGTAVTANISSISFSRQSGTSDLIDIEVAGQARGNSGVIITHTLRSSVRLRN